MTKPTAPSKAVALMSPDQNRTLLHDVSKHAIRPWIYEQRTGELFHYDTGQFVAKGYSGSMSALNDSSQEHLKSVGPVPRGLYLIGSPRHSERTGRFVLDLTPLGHKALGRSGLQIHGDNKHGNFSASSGCIVIDPKTRSEIANGSPLIVVI